MTITTRTAPDYAPLVRELAQDLAASWPSDPFAPVPIVVANRAVERWLRHELATSLEVMANVEFPGWRATLDALLRAVLTPPKEPRDGVRYWADTLDDDPWAAPRLRARIIELLRASRDAPEFAPVARYLYGSDPVPRAVSHRELALAGEIAATMDRLSRERPDDAHAFATNPALAPDTDEPPPAWFRKLCADVGLHGSDSPAGLRRRILAGEGRPLDGPRLRLFGLPHWSPSEARVVEALSRYVPITVYRPVFTRASGGDGRFVNPIAASFARADLPAQRLMPSAPVPDGAPTGQAASTLLARLQRWVRADAPFDGTTWSRDHSLTFHRTYGPLRQVEVLRDLLLTWFKADADLEPRDVLVLTPDLATYAPLIAATFATRGQAETAQTRAPAIPVHIADLGIASTNPLADVLLTLLELASERVTASRLMSLLDAWPVRERFGLDQDDVTDLRTLVIDSGLRWGLDPQDRARAGQPELEQNTVEFGLERLAFGVLMPEDGVEEGLDGGDVPVIPLAVEGRERSRRIAALMTLVRAAAEVRARFGEPDPDDADAPEWQLRTASAWRAELLAHLDDVAKLPPAQAWLRGQLEEALDEALAAAGSKLPIGLPALIRLLRGRFAIAQSGDRVITGAVTVSELRPGRTLPYKVIALLGMDDGAFPQVVRPRAWDPFAKPRAGEVDAADADRLALLESLMAASQRCVVLWSGFDQKTGAEMPACVPIEELLGVMARCTGVKADEIPLTHPLQPWSPNAFNGPVVPFDEGMARAATALRELARGEHEPTRSGLAASRNELLPDEDNPPTEVTLAELARDLENPARLFLYRRLDVYLPGEAPRMEDREPLELSYLDLWKVRDEAVRLLSSEPDAVTKEAVWRRFAGRGFLPLEAGGEHIAAEAAEEAAQIRAAYDAWNGQVVERDPISLQVAGITLAGRPERVRERGDELVLEWATASSAHNAKQKLTAWVTVLAARAAGWPVVAGRIVGKPKHGKASEALIAAPSPDEARATLQDLVAIWQLGRRKPLPLFAKTSEVIAKKVGQVAPNEPQPNAEALRATLAGGVKTAWFGVPERDIRGDSDDRWIATLFPDYDPTRDLDDLLTPERDGLVDLANRVWGPVTKAKPSKDALQAWQDRLKEAS